MGRVFVRACAFMDREMKSRSIKTQEGGEANIQSS